MLQSDVTIELRKTVVRDRSTNTLKPSPTSHDFITELILPVFIKCIAWSHTVARSPNNSCINHSPDFWFFVSVSHRKRETQINGQSSAESVNVCCDNFEIRMRCMIVSAFALRSPRNRVDYFKNLIFLLRSRFACLVDSRLEVE
jgi:hypothetical protein